MDLNEAPVLVEVARIGALRSSYPRMNWRLLG